MKKYYRSRTLWLNLIAAVAFFAQREYGLILDEQTQLYLLAALNFLLRLDTREPLGM